MLSVRFEILCLIEKKIIRKVKKEYTLVYIENTCSWTWLNAILDSVRKFLRYQNLLQY